ncbi:MAG: MBL fold metallo-hydrolase [Myxococcales bacterium]|nr:MBL fold metallo-hydrolase [Myxococcales bacterium]
MLPVRTPTLPPATHTNAFLVGDDDLVLVEPAPVERSERERLLRWIAATRRARGGRIVAVLATHHHHDHVGAADLARELGVPLIAHAETAARLRAPVDETLDDDARVALGRHTLRAVHTPGHAPGHLCFVHEASSTALVGDMVAGVGTILVEPSEGDMAAYLRSLERLRDAGFRKLLPAHGGVLATPHALLSHYITHRLAREAKVLARLEAHGATMDEELLSLVYDDAPPAVWPLARLSLRAHLDKLAAEGRVHHDGSRWSARA